MCSLKLSLLFKIRPRCFCGEKVSGGEKGFSSLLEKYTSVACLLMSELNNIFH